MEINYKIEHRNVKHPRLEFKRLTLHIILPYDMRDASEILEKRKAWIQKKWSMIQESVKNVSAPQGFMMFGQPFTMEKTNAQKPTIDIDQRKIRLDPRRDQKIITNQLKSLLKQKIEAIIKEYSEKLGCQPAKITIRQQKSKWGSCSNRKNLSLNLKLICLPERAIKYVIFHEMLHIKHKKHNRQFWEKIKEEFSEYEEMEKKLSGYHIHTETLLQNLHKSPTISPHPPTTKPTEPKGTFWPMVRQRMRQKATQLYLQDHPETKAEPSLKELRKAGYLQKAKIIALKEIKAERDELKLV
ncbi:MAG: WLM domain protein [Candidatus Bathyarchaeota archaeon BA2]|nr:MAG: WLM domain protein [Candidatus Bathyarchaeota archaeon BA2]